MSDETAIARKAFWECIKDGVSWEVFKRLLGQFLPKLQEPKAKTLWENDEVQFARLTAEIAGVGMSEHDLESLCDSMDLTMKELEELFERAEVKFQQVKETL